MESWNTNLPLRGLQKLLAFHLLGSCLGFSFPLCFMLKNSFGIFVILTWRMHIAITSLLRDKLPPFKRVLLFCKFYSFCNVYFSNRKQVLYLYVSSIFLCVICSSHKSESLGMLKTCGSEVSKLYIK